MPANEVREREVVVRATDQGIRAGRQKLLEAGEPADPGVRESCRCDSNSQTWYAD